MMKVVIPGGSGFLGKALGQHHAAKGNHVIVLSRHPREGSVYREVQWDGKTRGSWEIELEGADLLVNMAGRSVNCRYTEANKAEIYASRLDSTKVLGEAISAAQDPP